MHHFTKVQFNVDKLCTEVIALLGHSAHIHNRVVSTGEDLQNTLNIQKEDCQNQADFIDDEPAQ